MPKKIKEIKKLEFKGNQNKAINVNNIHYIIMILFVIGIFSVSCFGYYKYTKDKYHSKKSVAIIEFDYIEKAEEGYEVYSVDDLGDLEYYATYNDQQTNEMKKWGENKFLDFNEELYNTGYLDKDPEEKSEEIDYIWRLEVKYKDGSTAFYSNAYSDDVDKTDLYNLINKYFKKDIRYK